MPHYASLPTLRPRGVYPLDVLSKDGNLVFMAVDSRHCYAGWAEVMPGTDATTTEAALRRALDEADPPARDVLDGARPLRLMRFAPAPRRSTEPAPF